jgi:hypothetical protein
LTYSPRINPGDSGFKQQRRVQAPVLHRLAHWKMPLPEEY